MVQPHPMESIFVQQVEKLVEMIFRNEQPDPPIIEKLEKHLAHAQKLEAVSYEGETYNAIAIWHMVYADEPDEEQAFAYFEQAYDCAKKADNISLQTKMLNNLGSLASQQYRQNDALDYYQQSIELARTQTPYAMGMLFAISNSISIFLNHMQWDKALERVEFGLEIAPQVEVTPVTRNDYGRSIYFLRSTAVQVYLAHQQHKEAQEALKLAESLSTQLKIDNEQELAQNRVLCQLVIDKDEDAFQTYLDSVTEEFGGLGTGGLQIALLLHHLGFQKQAETIAKQVQDAIQELDNPQAQAQLTKLIAPVVVDKSA
ncbi:MAG: tetratricopeptide repeat protein [Chloroflexota bacterium]